MPFLAAALLAAAIDLSVDASRAVQGILRVHESVPVSAGPLTLVYPKWLPGEHAPNGPISNVTDLSLRANGTVLPWRRDPVDMYAFHVDVPAGVSSLDVDFAFLGGSDPHFDTGRLATPQIFTLEWNKVVLAPQAAHDADVTIVPSIRLPGTQWKYATALETATSGGAQVTFKPVSLEMLVDSPLDAGVNARTFDLGTWDGAPVALAAFADTPAELDAPAATQQKLRDLVAQMHALYRYRHFNHYTFLLTLSDQMPGSGLEHHQSSDDGTGGKFLINAQTLMRSGDLLPHEFNHSWDGKYRRPADLATPNLQVPMVDDLLWVYEGMTQFYGELQAERSGLRSEQEWLDGLALAYARLDTTTGRLHDPLIDTATASSIRRGIPSWGAERRGQDYYSEGALLWLEADVLIRNLSHGARSLDDLARAFFGNGADTGPMVVPYTRDDLIAALGAVQPYDWRGFLAARVDAVTPHPPQFFANAGYRVTYADTPSALQKAYASDERRGGLDMRYSLGISARKDGTITDVLSDSVAGRAGIGPGEKIVAIDDEALRDQDQIDNALRGAKNGTPIRLLLTAGGRYRTVALAYTGGPRYPRLERVNGTADVLGAIAKPLPVR